LEGDDDEEDWILFLLECGRGRGGRDEAGSASGPAALEAFRFVLSHKI
jgi:hypothetical protein